MLQLARGYFRKTVFKTYRYLKHPRRLKKNPLLRWFAHHFLTKRVWKPTRHTLAGGAAVGCFITVQLIPVQMPLAVLLCAALRLNIPIALVICWVSNPVTLVPIGVMEKEIGEWLLRWLGDPGTQWLETMENQSLAKTLAYARYMYLGGLVAGAIFAPIGYAITYASWTLVNRFTGRKETKNKAVAEAPAPPPS